ncbi:type II toxin-antitoxin system HipA family toxin [Achromobacter xylosoxidans]|uniref:type II toxin-antitoxin system HipA family toxin n=1 Tax=Alcaligenes xylosoxydans xylosoxydans TaxID=85698 RepID=UPI001EEA815E|nr:type II toxin-antitoxin system HipA family toxin [Achromobacter xylosoxidans]
MQIDVFFRDVLLGVLDRDVHDDFTFTYAPAVPAAHALSLNMPASTREWKSRTLFPIFQVSYPEGFLERLLEARLERESVQTSELEMLLACGHHRIGNLRLLPHAGSAETSHLDRTDEDAHIETSCLADLETTPLGKLPGISGGFRKYLGSAPDHSSPASARQWIVKANDADHPELTILEFFGMEVSRRMGLPTAKTILSQDRERLYVERFDIAEDGTPLQFEDASSLLGLPARDKYACSIERVVHAIRTIVAPEEASWACSNLFGQYVVASAIRNGDAHLKNFGVLYSPSSNPRLSPVYDMLTMGAYAPRANDGDALDGMALTLRGTRRWPRQADLDALAELCGVSPEEKEEWYRHLQEAIGSVSLSVLEFCRSANYDSATSRLARMLELWSFGCASNSPPASAVARNAALALRTQR